MNEQIHNEEVLNLFKEIESSPETTQRSLSQKLNISLGKTNYIIKALLKRGSISIKNFTTGSGKLKKVGYILTKKGFDERMNLTQQFLKRREQEYIRLKKEWESLKISNGDFGDLKQDDKNDS